MPLWVGRLPTDVGYPAGGSLSADEYKALITIYCPVIVSLIFGYYIHSVLTVSRYPLLWKEWQPLAQRDYEKKLKNWETNERKRVQRIEQGKAKPADKEPASKPELRMHPDDAENFLKLAAALKIVVWAYCASRRSRASEDTSFLSISRANQEVIVLFILCTSVLINLFFLQLHPKRCQAQSSLVHSLI